VNKKIASIVFSGALFGSANATEFITIGTGGVTGTYYPTGGAVCRLVNQVKKESGIRCSVESTGGSVYNVNTIRAGELDFGMAQSDVVHHAINGEDKFVGNPYAGLRSVMGIYAELLALVVSQESGIKSVSDLKGKRINIDIPGSGTRVTAEIVMKALGIATGDLALSSELKSTEGPNMLKDRKIDGYFGVFGHPAANIKDAVVSVDAFLVPIEGAPIDALTEKYPYYAKGLISGSFYRGITNDTPSIGVKAVLVTSDKISEKAVYTLTKAVVENFEEFKKLHPAYKTITKESLLEGIVAPLHPGAEKYYKEIGLL